MSSQGGEVRPEHLYKGAGLLFLFAVLLHFLEPILDVLLIAYAASVLAVLFNALIRRLPLERKWKAGALGLLIVATVGAALAFGIPLLAGQARDLAGRVPQFEVQLRSVEQWIRSATGMDVTLAGPGAWNLLRRVFLGGGSAGSLLSQAQGVLGALLIPLLILVGALYAVGKPNEQLLSTLLRAVPRRLRPSVRRILERLGDRIVGWGKGVLIGMVAVGLLSFLLYAIIGVPNALLLAVIAGLTEGIPLLGPWIGGAIATSVAFVAEPSKGVWTALAAIGIQQFENHLIVPFAMSTAAEIHPFVTLFSLVLFGSLFGFMGVILAIPLVLLLATVIEVLWVEGTIDSDQDTITPVVQD